MRAAPAAAADDALAAVADAAAAAADGPAAAGTFNAATNLHDHSEPNTCRLAMAC